MSDSNPSFDAIRGLAALSVSLFHAGTLGFAPIPVTWTVPGFIGVDIFFVLSGYLISSSVTRPAVFHCGTYLKRRARRILPAYFACMLLLLALVDPRPIFTAGSAGNLLTHLTLSHGWFSGWSHSINAPFWTLSHEWTFYLLMAALATPMRQPRGALALGIVFVIVGCGSRWIVKEIPGLLPNGREHPLAMLDRFGFGIIAAWWVQHPSAQSWMTRRNLRCGLAAAGTALIAWAAFKVLSVARSIDADKLRELDAASYIARALSKQPWHFQRWPLAAGAGAALLLAALSGGTSSGRLAGFLRHTPLPWMGKVSYSTYLWHMPILFAAATASRKLPGTHLDDPVWKSVFVFGLIYLVSWVSWRSFELSWMNPPRTQPADRV